MVRSEENSTKDSGRGHFHSALSIDYVGKNNKFSNIRLILISLFQPNAVDIIMIIEIITEYCLK